MEDPPIMHKHGTRIEADCIAEVTVLDDIDNEVVIINGWLWSIEVIDEPSA